MQLPVLRLLTFVVVPILTIGASIVAELALHLHTLANILPLLVGVPLSVVFPCVQVWRAHRAGRRLLVLGNQPSYPAFFMLFAVALLMFGVNDVFVSGRIGYGVVELLIAANVFVYSVAKIQIREGGVYWPPLRYVPWQWIASYSMRDGNVVLYLYRERLLTQRELPVPLRQDQQQSVDQLLARHIPEQHNARSVSRVR